MSAQLAEAGRTSSDHVLRSCHRAFVASLLAVVVVLDCDCSHGRARDNRSHSSLMSHVRGVRDSGVRASPSGIILSPCHLDHTIHLQYCHTVVRLSRTGNQGAAGVHGSLSRPKHFRVSARGQAMPV